MPEEPVPRVDARKPWLLVDVDGVLNPLGPGRKQPGFFTHTARDNRGREYILRLSPAHGEWLLALGDIFEVAWCTTWHRSDDLDQVIAPALGLPAGLPRVPLPRWSTADWPYRCSPKTPSVRRWLNGRAAAWLDDDFQLIDADEDVLLSPEDQANLLTAQSPPAERILLLPCNPALGLQREHIEQARAWTEPV